MQRLNHVLKSAEFPSETKVHAMIAVGDVCLAIEENFLQYFNESVKCLLSAAGVTLEP